MSEDPFAALADCPRWVSWRAEARGASGKPTKIPCDPRRTGRKADTTDPQTWGTRGEAETAARRLLSGADGGVGVVLGDLGGDLFRIARPARPALA
jgi:primase-polymerase (primpol)-like protein